MIKKYKWAIILFLGVSAAVFFFIDHFYYGSIRKLVAFSASYDTFDKAISDLSVSKGDDLESQAVAALTELKTKAAFRISSLIKNDGDLMNQARQVADLSGSELASLEAYLRAIQNRNANLDEMAGEYSDLAGKRKAAFAHFRELCGSNI